MEPETKNTFQWIDYIGQLIWLAVLVLGLAFGISPKFLAYWFVNGLIIISFLALCGVDPNCDD